MAKHNDKSDQHDDDFALFRQTVGAVKPMQQDKFTPPKSVKLQEKQRNPYFSVSRSRAHQFQSGECQLCVFRYLSGRAAR